MLNQLSVMDPKYIVFAQIPGSQLMFACTNLVEVKKSFEAIKKSIGDVRIYILNKENMFTDFESFEKAIL